MPFCDPLNGVSLLISAFTECFIDVPRAPKTGMPINLKTLFSDLRKARRRCSATAARIIIIIACPPTSAQAWAVFLPFCLGRGLDVVQYGYLMSLVHLRARPARFSWGTLNIKPQLDQAHVFGFPLSFPLLFALCYP